MKAHVHCVIVGISFTNGRKKILYDNEQIKYVKNINSYLSEAPNIFIESHSTPLCNVPPMHFGNMPRDGGGFILSPQEKEELITRDPNTKAWIREYLGAEEFINNKKRYCLWLGGVSTSTLRNSPLIIERIQRVREFRISSKAAATRKFEE